MRTRCDRCSFDDTIKDNIEGVITVNFMPKIMIPFGSPSDCAQKQDHILAADIKHVPRHAGQCERVAISRSRLDTFFKHGVDHFNSGGIDFIKHRGYSSNHVDYYFNSGGIDFINHRGYIINHVDYYFNSGGDSIHHGVVDA